jgi:serine/threonine protein phosphatase PrpC
MTRRRFDPAAIGSEDDTLLDRNRDRAGVYWDTCGATDQGHVRQINEDAYCDDQDKRLWVVADGMGGHSAGDVASHTIVEAFRRLECPERLSAIADLLETTLLGLNAKFLEMADYGRGGVTIGSTVVILTARQGWLLYLWVGDSRIYRWRDGALQQLTQDHSQVEDLIAQGLLLRENAESHPAANVVTRAVGAGDELYVDLDYSDIQAGDRYLLCSDGLTKEVDDGTIAAILAGDTDAGEMCDALIAATLAARARDNVTVIVVRAVGATGDTPE